MPAPSSTALLLFAGLILSGCAEAEEPFDVFIFDPAGELPTDGLEADPAADAAGEPDAILDPAADFPVDEAHEDPAFDEPVDSGDVDADIPVDTPVDAESPDPEPDPDAADMIVDDPDGEDPACGSSTCRPGETCCYGMICVDLSSDADNCGTCGNICWPSEADSCVSGSCICSGSSRKCTGNLDDTCCESDGCRDLWTDDDHCGMCGWWCSFGEDCVSGWCE
jgi:hypothetical protein